MGNEKKFSRHVIGVLTGIVAAASYGMNPLFALPLYQEGFTPDAVLFCRYLPATVLLGLLLLIRRIPFRLDRREFLLLFICGMLFGGSSLALYLSYQKMAAGIASTLLFVYPLLTALLMTVVFKEKIHPATWIALGLSLAGIVLLCRTSEGDILSVAGLVLVLFSSLSYAIYMIIVGTKQLTALPALKISFYSLLFGALLFLARLLAGCGHMGNFSTKALLNIIALAVVPTLISLFCTTRAIHLVGATTTAVLGAFEPLTAVFFGVLIFHEDFTLRIAIGIALILAGVTLVALIRKK